VFILAAPDQTDDEQGQVRPDNPPKCDLDRKPGAREPAHGRGPRMAKISDSTRREGGNSVHSAVHSPGQSFSRYRYFGFTTRLGGSTVVSSKNGDLSFQANTTVKALIQTYPYDIKIYTDNP
jgi:hypothetical protein